MTLADDTQSTPPPAGMTCHVLTRAYLWVAECWNLETGAHGIVVLDGQPPVSLVDAAEQGETYASAWRRLNVRT